MSEVLETNDSRWIPGLADHSVDLLLPPWITVVAGGSQTNDMPALQQHLAGVEDRAEQERGHLRFTRRGRRVKRGSRSPFGYREELYENHQYRNNLFLHCVSAVRVGHSFVSQSNAA